ncbi:MAG TPA: hypothetical protein DEP27_07735 [Ruminococcaceae bacterium]|nr:hypothetical protein [Oscillospiraceae bacterium]
MCSVWNIYNCICISLHREDSRAVGACESTCAAQCCRMVCNAAHWTGRRIFGVKIQGTGFTVAALIRKGTLQRRSIPILQTNYEIALGLDHLVITGFVKLHFNSHMTMAIFRIVINCIRYLYVPGISGPHRNVLVACGCITGWRCCFFQSVISSRKFCEGSNSHSAYRRARLKVVAVFFCI